MEEVESMKHTLTSSRNDVVTAARFAEATNLSLISVDSEGNIEFVNASACSLFGYDRNEMMGQPITIIIPERMRGAHISGLARVAAGEKPNLGGKTVEVFALKKDGSEFPIEITLSVWEGKGGLNAGAVIKDISERRERESRLLRMASQDTLTGLQNKQQFMQVLEEQISSGQPATIVLIDLDGFKDVNDTHGHAAGDSLLQAVGVRLPYLLRADAVIARLGGDEFAVLFPGIGDPLAAQAQASEILVSFGKPFHLGGMVLDLAASIGVAISPDHGSDAEELVASADFALYRAKAAGGRCYRLFEQAMRNEARARRATRDELKRAMRVRELELYYQPQVRLETGEITGFEALIRWNHPQKGLLMPGAFLPALEQSALALEIGWWTLDEACRQIARLNRDGGHLKIAVNLFPAQFRALNLREKVAEAIAQHGISPACLELEITEEVALNSDERSLKTLSALRDMGVGIAFDDFGTGYASLISLKRYPLTTLKIDRGFVRDLLTDRSSAAIIRALIGIGNDLGLKTVAEGIETVEQEAALLGLGCPSGQGYHYGKAMPEGDMDRLLRAASHT
jgi:diguanylate cyclase (GGDEF)-like protein/PAS domain S-box-containing protein